MQKPRMAHSAQPHAWQNLARPGQSRRDRTDRGASASPPHPRCPPCARLPRPTSARRRNRETEDRRASMDLRAAGPTRSEPPGHRHAGVGGAVQGDGRGHGRHARPRGRDRGLVGKLAHRQCVSRPRIAVALADRWRPGVDQPRLRRGRCGAAAQWLPISKTLFRCRMGHGRSTSAAVGR